MTRQTAGAGTVSVGGSPDRPVAAGTGGRRRQPWRAAFFALAAVAILGGAAWALLGSRFFVVRNVAVTGTHLVPAAEVRSAAAIPLGIPLIRVNGAAVARRVDRIPQVQSVHVSQDWPSGVTISVTERRPALAVANDGGYQLIDRHGVAIESVPRPPEGVPRLILPPGTASLAPLRGSPAVYAAAQVVQELPRWIARTLAAVQAPSATEVTLRLDHGITIVWGGTDRAAVKARELSVLMRTHARTYDVSSPGTAVTSG
jgi:cell division protein FtsQ